MHTEMIEKKIFDQAKEYGFDYADKAMDRNVFPTEEAIENLKFFDENLPVQSNHPSDVLEMLHKYGAPATTTQVGGRYFGFVTGGTIPTAMAVKLMADFWDQNSGLYAMSPIVSKLETVVENWLKQIFGLPGTTVAAFVSGTSMAILSGLTAARFKILKRLNWNVNSKGLFNAPKIRIVAGKQTHSAVLRAIAILGFGVDNIEWVDVDDQGRMFIDQIPALDESTILILQAGNVCTGSFDHFDEICDVAKKANAWVHIDGAFGLWAAAADQLKHKTKGMEKADSWSVDAHKTLNTPYDSGILLCKDRESLVAALQANGSYLIYGDKRDGMLYTPEMSRRARAVELWATLKYLGKQGIDELVYGLYEKSLQFAKELKDEGFQILNEVVFNQVLVACENDELTEKTLAHIQTSGECWCGGADYNNQKVIRISVCSWATTKHDISRSVAAFVKAREAVQDEK